MNALKEWVTSLCVASLLTGLVSILAPSGSGAKSVKTISGIFLICALISPLISGVDFNFDFDIDNISATSQSQELYDEVLQQTKEAAADNITEQVRAVLSAAKITDAKIEINMDISDDRRISINQVDICIMSKTDMSPDEIKQLVENSVGLEANISVEKKDDNYEW